MRPALHLLAALLLAAAAPIGLTLADPAGGGQAPTFRSKVEIVRVDALVTQDGRPMIGLKPSDFEVFDNGVPQRIDHAAFEDVPLNLVLALDTSTSVEGERARHLRTASHGVLDRLKKDDQAALVTFSNAILLPDRLTRDLAAVKRALDQPLPVGDTSLADATYAALLLAESQPGRSLVIVFTDGVEVSSYLPAGSVLEATKRSEAVIDGVAVKGVGRSKFLRDLADASGGEVFEAASSSDLGQAFANALDQFRSRYLFSYTPQGVERQGWHRLDVRVKRPGARVKARAGYVRD